jgi:tetratricopeptide (TPR) repeat protein
MPERPLLSATLICRDEKHNVRRCLDAIWDHVDEVCVADTGSKDGTVAELRRYAKRRGQPGKLKVTRHEWSDDFSAARQAADDLASGEWLCWCDLDDEVRGLAELRKLAAGASEDVQAYFVRYSYARDQGGNTIAELWRERVVRNDGTRWTGRLHEHKLVTQGTVITVDPRIAEWIHHRDHSNRTGERNVRILEAWLADEPEEARIVSALAMELMGQERHREASDMFERLLAMDGEPPDRRSQAHRHLCQMLLCQGRVDEARAAAYRSLTENYGWADTHLSLAEAEQTAGRPDLGYLHAQTALTIGKPQTWLIINPLHYTAHPRALQAVCLAQMGRFEDAVAKAQECLEIAPGYPLANHQLPAWRAQLKKRNTVHAVLALCDVLIEAGELEKARAVLRSAPYYVCEEADLIARRTALQAMIEERIKNPVQLPEDPAADAFVARQLEEAA